MVPVRDANGRVVSRLREITVAGVFEIGVRDHDSVRVLLSLADAASLAGLGDNVTGVRLQMADIFAAPDILQRWTAGRAAAGHAAIPTTDWTRDNASYFRAVRIEKVMMTLLAVVDRGSGGLQYRRHAGDDRHGQAAGDRDSAYAGFFAARDHCHLRAAGSAHRLGGRNRRCRCPAACWPETSLRSCLRWKSLFGFEFMPADVYYLTSLPVDLQADDIIWVSTIALLMTACATIYPALRAASVDPAEVLRYE